MPWSMPQLKQLEGPKHEAVGNCGVALSAVKVKHNNLGSVHPIAEKAVLSKETSTFHLGNSPGIKVPNPPSPMCLCYVFKAVAEDTGFGEKNLSRLGVVYESVWGGRTAVVVPCFDRRVTWQVLSAEEAGLPYQSNRWTCLADTCKRGCGNIGS